MKKEVVKTKRTNASGSYVNQATGEVLSFKEGDYVTTSTPTSMDVYSSKIYNYIELETLKRIQTLDLKAQELGLILILVTSLEFKTNICLKEEGTPFSTKTIASRLGYSQQYVKALLNNLIKTGVLYKGKIKESKYPSKDVYILNPHLIRRGKNFYKSIGKNFTDFSETELMNNQSVLKTTFGEF